MMDEGAAFFADSAEEFLTWDEDPADHPLMAEVSVALIDRYHRTMSVAVQRVKPRICVNVIRNGKRRISVPVAA